MRNVLVGLGMGWVGVAAAMAQMSIPRNPLSPPTAFDTRSVGGSVSPGAMVEPVKPADGKVRYVTHVVLFDSRFWTSSEGKPLEAKLIAFEDLVAEAPKGSGEPLMPAPPERPTVIRSGKVRLLVKGKPVELALDRLSRQDQEFIEGIRAALAKKAAGK